MPNHITNILTIEDASESELIQILDKIKFEKPEQESKDDCYGMGTIDFNKIVVTPDNIYQGSIGEEERKRYKPEEMWYEWNIKNWGTKWNAYSQNSFPEDDISNEITFQTAWSTPEPIILALSKLFPNVVIKVKFADEDFGSNCGWYRYKNGELLEQEIFEYSADSRLFAADILGIDDAGLHGYTDDYEYRLPRYDTVITCQSCKGDIKSRYTHTVWDFENDYHSACLFKIKCPHCNNPILTEDSPLHLITFVKNNEQEEVEISKTELTEDQISEFRVKVKEGVLSSVNSKPLSVFDIVYTNVDDVESILENVNDQPVDPTTSVSKLDCDEATKEDLIDTIETLIQDFEKTEDEGEIKE